MGLSVITHDDQYQRLDTVNLRKQMELFFNKHKVPQHMREIYYKMIHYNY